MDRFLESGKNVAIMAAFFFLLLLEGCSSDIEIEKLNGSTMGTSWSVVIVNPARWHDKKNLQAEIGDVLREVSRQMSTYDLDSEISKFNTSDVNGDWYSVSKLFAITTAKALNFAEISLGAFDPTIGPLVNLWGFGPEDTTDSLPSDVTIAEVKSQVGYNQISVRMPKENGGPAIKKHQSRQLDLSAIAKGMGVDQIYELLDDKAYTNFLVEIGGEVRVKGNKDGLGWKVAVEKPLKGQRSVQQFLSLSNIALATSGDYRNYREIDGVAYSHTINPGTGRPVVHSLASVTVVHEECVEADGWATTLLVLGPQKGYELAISRKLAALFIERTSDGFVERTTPDYEMLLAGEI